MANEHSSEHLTTLVKGLNVLTSFSRDNPSMTLSEVAKRTGLNPAVARRCLLTLCDLGYIGKTDGRFTLRPEVLVFANLFNETFDLDHVIRPALQDLRTQTGHSASFTLLSGGDVLYVAHISTQRVIRLQANTGTRFPALVTSTGRCILSTWQDHEISIETAQSDLDCSVLSSLPDQTILLGVIDLSSPEVESVDTIVDWVEKALPHIDQERVVLAPDCGMKYLPRDASLQKLCNMTAAARFLREKYGA